MLRSDGRERVHRIVDRFPWRILFLPCLFALIGCGGGHQLTPPPTLFQISEQPTSVSTPLGRTATFSVLAQGPGTLTYQWMANGVAIPGATSASYTTPPVALGQNGTVFTVVITDNGQQLTSNAVTLSVGPRSPASGDLRFQLVDSSAVAQGENSWSYSCCMQYPWGYSYSGSVGTPLRIGGGICGTRGTQNCAWAYNTRQVANKSESITYSTDVPENLASDLKTWINSSTVATSLDIESAQDVYAISYIQDTAHTGFDTRLETASLAGLAAAVAQDGSQGRVVTAVTFNDATQQVTFLSSGWSADTSTVYDTSIQTAPYANLASAATQLANAGFIITAFGGNPTDGYVLVGTRVHGDTLARPIIVIPPAPTSSQTVGYAQVGLAYSNGDHSVTWIFEK